MDYKVAYHNWLDNPKINAEGYQELHLIKDDDNEIKNKFDGFLKFNKNSVRGLIGYGTNMMNIYTVARITKGLCEYIKSLGTTAIDKGVVISYDTRKNSLAFAKKTSGVLLSYGIKVYLFESPKPVSLLSFAIRKFKAIAGVMITAGSQSKEYNGYEIYGDDGVQMSIENIQKIANFIDKIDDYFSIDEKPVINLKSKGLLTVISNKLDKKYVKAIKKLSLSKKAIKKSGGKLKIVYTPLHGTGYAPITLLFKKLGIDFSVCDEQIMPDSEFSTIKIPNPQEKETLNIATKIANKISADVVLGTSCDCGRLGVLVKNEQGEFINLTSYQISALLLNYILYVLKKENKLSTNDYVVKNLTTTNIVKSICSEYGVNVIETPVGFDFKKEKIDKIEKSEQGTFIFGLEQSCGYLKGTHLIKIDAVILTMLFTEMACYYRHKGKSIYSVLNELYEKYGYAIEETISISYSGKDALNIAVEKLKTQEIKNLGIYNVYATKNYIDGTVKYANGNFESLDCDSINSIYYELEIGGFICVKQSNIESKLTVHYSVKGKTKQLAEKAIQIISNEFEKYLK